MIALIVRHLLLDARGYRALDRRIPSRVVVGRPVHFSNARDGEDDEFALATAARRDRAMRIRGHRVRVRAGGGRVQLRADARPRRADPDWRLRRRHERLLHSARRARTERRRGRAREASSAPTASRSPATRSTGRSSASSSRRDWASAPSFSRRRTSSCRSRAGRTNGSSAGIICRF